MIEVEIAEAQQRLAELIDAARNGDEVYITRRGQRVAKLVPVPPRPGWRHIVSAQGMTAMADTLDITLEGFAGDMR